MTKIETRQKDKAEKFWDTVSKRFGNPNRTINSPALLTVRQNSDKYFKRTDTVLDFGCGQGDITFEIAQKTKEVYGIDYSKGMIVAAHQMTKEHNLENVKFLKTDLFDGSFQNNSFDVITAFNVLHYIYDKNELYKKIYELLKPQGLFISSTACLRERLSTLRFIMSGLTSFGVVPKMIFYKTRELENEIEKADFTLVETTNITKFPERFIVAKKN